MTKKIWTAFVLLILSYGVSAQGIGEFLPDSGVIQGDVMVPGASPELEGLAIQIQAAIAANPDWFQSYAAQAQDGALPYHVNFGISEEEYAKFLSLSQTDMSLQRVATISMTMEKRENGTTFLAVDPADFPLNGLSFSPDGQFVDTPYGRLGRSTDINQQDPDSPTGRWSGPSWVNEEITDTMAWRAQFAIGERPDSRDGIIYYNVIYQGAPEPEQYQFVILYALP